MLNCTRFYSSNFVIFFFLGWFVVFGVLFWRRPFEMRRCVLFYSVAALFFPFFNSVCVRKHCRYICWMIRQTLLFDEKCVAFGALFLTRQSRLFVQWTDFQWKRHVFRIGDFMWVKLHFESVMKTIEFTCDIFTNIYFLARFLRVNSVSHNRKLKYYRTVTLTSWAQCKYSSRLK